MKVKELITQLKKVNQELPVMVAGYESGVNNVLTVKSIEVVLDANPGRWYYGQHARSMTHYAKEKATLSPAIELHGANLLQDEPERVFNWSDAVLT